MPRIELEHRQMKPSLRICRICAVDHSNSLGISVSCFFSVLISRIITPSFLYFPICPTHTHFFKAPCNSPGPWHATLQVTYTRILYVPWLRDGGGGGVGGMYLLSLSRTNKPQRHVFGRVRIKNMSDDVCVRNFSAEGRKQDFPRMSAWIGLTRVSGLTLASMVTFFFFPFLFSQSLEYTSIN